MVLKRYSPFFFSIFTFLGYVLNRSELWGLFFARYNPNYFEYIFGGGPLNFGQLYSEVDVKETESLLFPTFFTAVINCFFGLFGVGILIYKLTSKLIKIRKRLIFEDTFIVFYIILNLVKSDSINYIHSFTLYYFLLFLVFNFNKPIFEDYKNKPTT